MQCVAVKLCCRRVFDACKPAISKSTRATLRPGGKSPACVACKELCKVMHAALPSSHQPTGCRILYGCHDILGLCPTCCSIC